MKRLLAILFSAFILFSVCAPTAAAAEADSGIPASYTVDFHYNGSVCSIQGGSSILLSELLQSLGYTDHTADEAESVSFSDESLLQVIKQENDWLLTSLQPFNSEEALTLVFSDGSSISLKVTDNSNYPIFQDVDGVNAHWSVWDGGVCTVTVHLYESDATTFVAKQAQNKIITYGWFSISGDYWFEVFKTNGIAMSSAAYDDDSLSCIHMGAMTSLKPDLYVKRFSRELFGSSNPYATVWQRSEFVKSGDTTQRNAQIHINGSSTPSSTVTNVWFPDRQNGILGSDIDYIAPRTGYATRSVASGGTQQNVTTSGSTYQIWLYTKYRIVFNGNGADSGTMSNQQYYYGFSQNLNTNQYSKTGYVFTGWNTKPDGTGTAYNNGQSISNLTETPNGVINLYAQWTPNIYTITWKNYDGAVLETNNVTHGSTPVYTGATPTRPDSNGYRYSFNGWAPDVSPAEQSVIYTAQYTQTPITYTVSYDANGGSGAPAGQSKTHGTNLTLSTQVPTLSGYEFTGWNTNANGSGTSYQPGGVYSANADVTLYAQWKASDKTTTLTVTKNINGSTDPNQVFVFTIQSKSDPSFTMTVTLHGSESLVIYDLPIGEYTVTEDMSWAWQYTAETESQPVSANAGQQNTASFTNTRKTDIPWFTDCAMPVENIYGAGNSGKVKRGGDGE